MSMSDRNRNGDDDEYNDVQYIEEDKEYIYIYIYIDDDNDDNDVQ